MQLYAYLQVNKILVKHIIVNQQFFSAVVGLITIVERERERDKQSEQNVNQQFRNINKLNFLNNCPFFKLFNLIIFILELQNNSDFLININKISTCKYYIHIYQNYYIGTGNTIPLFYFLKLYLYHVLTKSYTYNNLKHLNYL